MIFPMRWLQELFVLTLPLWLPVTAQGQLPDVLQAGPDPVPVLVVPGWGDNAPDVEPIRQRLIGAGWPESRVSTLSFKDPVGSNAEHAAEIETAARVLRGLTGADRIDIVAHSMGGLAVRYYLKQAAEAEADGVPVRRVVFLGTPHRGTVAAVLAWGDGGREMVPGSDFLMGLQHEGGVPEGVEALAVRTPVDLRVIPASSAVLRGDRVQNVELCCPTHTQLVDDEQTFEAILDFLVNGPDSVRDMGGRPVEWLVGFSGG